MGRALYYVMSQTTHTDDNTSNKAKADLFSRYAGSRKLEKYNVWRTTPHGKLVCKLFKEFAARWRDAGHDKCSSALIVHRLRWECGVIGKYQGFKISNDFAPMLSRQLATDDPTYTNFFDFHADPEDHLNIGVPRRPLAGEVNLYNVQIDLPPVELTTPLN